MSDFSSSKPAMTHRAIFSDPYIYENHPRKKLKESGMQDNQNKLATLSKSILHSLEKVTMNFFRNGSERTAYLELDHLFEQLIELMTFLAQSQHSMNTIPQRLTHSIQSISISLANDDTVKICDQLNFELNPILSELVSDNHDT